MLVEQNYVCQTSNWFSTYLMDTFEFLVKLHYVSSPYIVFLWMFAFDKIRIWRVLGIPPQLINLQQTLHIKMDCLMGAPLEIPAAICRHGNCNKFNQLPSQPDSQPASQRANWSKARESARKCEAKMWAPKRAECAKLSNYAKVRRSVCRPPCKFLFKWFGANMFMLVVLFKDSVPAFIHPSLTPRDSLS